MRRKRRAAVVLVLLTVVGVSAAAIAGNGGRPQVEQVEASITYTHVVGKERICEGRDGVEFVEQRQVRVMGTATGDPRLSGNVTLNVPRLFVELESGDGFWRGTLVIRGSGKKKLHARFTEGGIAEIFQGSLVGRVRGHGNLYANWRTTFHQNGAVTAQIGGVAADGRLPAVVLSGRCRGPFERFDVDLPAPPADGARQSRAPVRLGKWGASR
jgi:hypothetical protein